MKSAPMISITGNNKATVLNPGRSEDAFVLWGTRHTQCLAGNSDDTLQSEDSMNRVGIEDDLKTKQNTHGSPMYSRYKLHYKNEGQRMQQ